MPIDYTTAAGQVRLLIADTDETRRVLEDDQVDGFLTLHGITDSTTTAGPSSSVKRAAADALDAIATSEALVSKVMRTQTGVSTDGAKVAQALRAHAQELRVQAAQLDEDGDDVAFEVAEFSPYPWPVY